MPKPKILLAFSSRVRESYVDNKQLARLESFADWDWFECEGGGIESASIDDAASQQLAEKITDYDGVILCHGSPPISADILKKATKLKILGELEGDRFAARIDLEAAWEQGIRTVDTTNASSYPVAEWALGLILISLRNIGMQFRRMISGQQRDLNPNPYRGVLRGKRVGLIGCGNMGRRLISYLRPFDVEIWVHDPYLPREMADALDFLQTSFENILTKCDVIVCLAPLTPATRGMVGKQEIDMIPPGTAFVNVSRGPIVDSDALIERLKKNDITAGLEVWDPEPVPADSEIRNLNNAFVTPHSSAQRAEGEKNEFFEMMVDEFDRFFHGHETKYDLTPASQANRTASKLPSK
ncbi:MAG: NAD(P)-dependent oxidoreductase [Candidatus Latescibacterota bacterium]|nr:NAD(P)-dependent oxidoreductase [Candidatus Latescibacterota bacterium]